MGSTTKLSKLRTYANDLEQERKKRNRPAPIKTGPVVTNSPSSKSENKETKIIERSVLSGPTIKAVAKNSSVPEAKINAEKAVVKESSSTPDDRATLIGEKGAIPLTVSPGKAEVRDANYPATVITDNKHKRFSLRREIVRGLHDWWQALSLVRGTSNKNVDLPPPGRGRAVTAPATSPLIKNSGPAPKVSTPTLNPTEIKASLYETFETIPPLSNKRPAVVVPEKKDMPQVEALPKVQTRTEPIVEETAILPAPKRVEESKIEPIPRTPFIESGTPVTFKTEGDTPRWETETPDEEPVVLTATLTDKINTPYQNQNNSEARTPVPIISTPTRSDSVQKRIEPIIPVFTEIETPETTSPSPTNSEIDYIEAEEETGIEIQGQNLETDNYSTYEEAEQTMREIEEIEEDLYDQPTDLYRADEPGFIETNSNIAEGVAEVETPAETYTPPTPIMIRQGRIEPIIPKLSNQAIGEPVITPTPTTKTIQPIENNSISTPVPPVPVAITPNYVESRLPDFSRDEASISNTTRQVSIPTQKSKTPLISYRLEKIILGVLLAVTILVVGYILIGVTGIKLNFTEQAIMEDKTYFFNEAKSKEVIPTIITKENIFRQISNTKVDEETVSEVSLLTTYNGERIPGSTIVQLLGFGLSPASRANINQVTFGYYRGEPWMIIEFTDFASAKGTMLQWESVLPTDLNPLFTTSQNRGSSARFTDSIINNTDVRVLSGGTENEEIVYGFIYPTAILIANNETTFLNLHLNKK